MFPNSQKTGGNYIQEKYKKKPNDNLSKNLLSLLQKMSSKSDKFNEGNRNELIPVPLEFEYTCTLNSTEKEKVELIKKAENEQPKQKNQFLPLYEGSALIGGGLNNVGNTCFLNSVLQSIMFTLPMNNYFLHSNHLKICKVKNNVCLLCEFCKLCSELQCRKSLTPYNIIRNIKVICKHIRIGRQEDAHEFLIYLLDALEKSYNNFSKSINTKFIVDNKSKQIRNVNLIQNIFGGELSSEVQCMKCKKSSVTIDKFLSVSLEILNSDSIEKSIDNFCKSELLFGANKFLCAHCKVKNDSKKRLLFKTLPNVLILHLKRFDNYGRKIQRFIRYSNELDMGKYLANPGKTLENMEGGTKYRLYSVLIHNGYSSDSGHYYSFLKSEKGWYEMNDSFVEKVGDQYAMTQVPYLFFYKKINVGKHKEFEREKKIEKIKEIQMNEIRDKKKEEEKQILEKKEIIPKTVWKNEKIDVEKINTVYKSERQKRLEKLTKLRKKLLSKHSSKKIIENKEIDIKEDEKVEEEKNQSYSSEENLKNNSLFLEMKKQFEKNKNKIDHLYNEKEIEKDEEFEQNKEYMNKLKEHKNIPSNLKSLYHSNKISLWEDDTENEEEKQQSSNELLQNQLSFLEKEKAHFLHKKLKRKSDYDKQLDKGKMKKIRKKENNYKQNKNLFQYASEKLLNNQN